MGLRCLLGHDFGPPEIEREREENGDEMVVTVREVETCRRCGEERVVSENKEVTAIRSPDELGLDASADGAAADADDPAGSGESPVDAPTAAGQSTAGDESAPSSADLPSDAEDDGVILDDEDAARGHGEWPDAGGTTASEDADRVDAAAETIAEAGGDASTESAPASERAGDEGVELIDADDGAEAPDDEQVDRQDERASAESAAGAPAADRGESAAAESAAREGDESAPEAAAGESAAWPDHDGTDEGFDASPASGGGPADVSFGGGLTPDAGASAGGTDDRGRGEYVGVEGEDGDEEFEDIVRVDSEAGGDVTEFFCPNCGLSERAGETSMRVGDICPSCHKGYIAERNA
jgi:hypothetical protein